MMDRAIEEWRDRFENHWNDVAVVLEALKTYGIYYFDPRPSNIDSGEDNDALPSDEA